MGAKSIIVFLAVIVSVFLVIMLVNSEKSENPKRYHSRDVVPESDIDLVILWVDGTDKVWLDEKTEVIRTLDQTGTSSHAMGASRFENFDELRYNLRGVEMYAPWIRKVHLVVAGDQFPDYLKRDHPKLNVVRHTDIMSDTCVLPTYNSSVIESHIYKIKGLSERFLYANDDMFFASKVKESDFFRDGKPIFYNQDTVVVNAKKYVSEYQRCIADAVKLVDSRFGTKPRKSQTHFIKPFTVSLMRETYETFSYKMETFMGDQFRGKNEIIFPQLCMSYGMEKGMVVPVTMTFFKAYAVNFTDNTYEFALKYAFSRLMSPSPIMVCMNDDSSHTKPSVDRMVASILKSRYPEPSSYEC